MTNKDSLTNSQPTFKMGVFIFGCGQLILGLISANWAWSLWKKGETGVPAGFWAALALTLFLFGIAQINLIGPFRDSGYSFSGAKIALPYRLKPLWGGEEMIWPMFSIAMAFGLPVIPMILFILNIEGNLAELRIIWVGLTLMGVIVGGSTFYLGLKKLYQRLIGSTTIVEVSAETAIPGERLSILVRHTPGRLATEYIQVKLVCRNIVRRSGEKSSENVRGTNIIYESDIQPSIRIESATWQKSLQVVLPADAPLSTHPDANPNITWAIDVIAQIPNAPDIIETFVFMVDDPELRTLLEAEADEESSFW